jgi:hypothetical protein
MAFAIRLHNLGGDSFWGDEIFTTRDASQGWNSFAGNRTHPGLFYLITAATTSVYGTDEFAFRLPSLFFGTLAIALIILAGKMLGRTSVGLWAALLLSLSTLHLRYSQEARMYSQLMTLSLLSFILLYSALKRPRWPLWLAFAVVTILNIYTHYGALIVLIAQSLIIAVWAIRNIFVGNIRLLIYPIASGLIVVLLYLPWLPRFINALQYNVGAEAVTNIRVREPLVKWLRIAYSNFGMNDDRLAMLFLGLFLLGIVFWIIKHQWLKLIMILGGLMLPLALIYIFQIARGAFSRYIIFLLPLYLLGIAYGIDQLLIQGKQRFGRTFYAVGIIGLTAAFVWVALPKIQDEHKYVHQDWRGIVNYLHQNADEGDVVLSMTMNISYNLVGASMPKYLEQDNNSYQFYEGNNLDREDVTALKKNNNNVWAVVSHWGKPTLFEGQPMNVTHFQTDLHVVNDLDGNGNALDSAIELYEHLLPMASTPVPLCLLQMDLVNLYFAADDPKQALSLLNEATAQCPDRIDGKTFIERHYHQEIRDSFASALASGDEAVAREMALDLIQYDPKNPEALELLTFEDLRQRFESGQVTVNPNGAPQPVEVRQFTMPRDGDWGDVIFMHPPASVSFTIELPDEPVALQSRIALDPQSWEWGGDGVTFVATVEKETGATADIFRHHISNDESSHDWRDVYVSLTDFAGQTVTLTLKTEVGPAGDGTGDWAGWDSPRLMWEVSKNDPEKN